jgi:hypothetical protein
MTYSLNQNDRTFLYKKYISLGLTPKEAYQEIKKLSEHIRFLAEKLRAKRVNEEEIKLQMQQEFEKEYMKLAGKF